MSTTETSTVPVGKRSGPGRPSHKELDSRSIDPPAPTKTELPPLNEPIRHESEIIIPETPLMKDQATALQFSEDPVTILIHRSAEKFSPRCTDLIAVNGKLAEMLFRNGWVQIGYLPRGIEVTTKRKYVEQLASSKINHINTISGEVGDRVLTNTIEKITTPTCTFSLIEDKNPLGREWLSQLLRRA